MYAFIFQIFPFIFIPMWFGIGIAIFLQVRKKQRAYLRRFPPVQGAPLDMIVAGGPFGPEQRAIRDATFRRQDDPELEQMRRAVNRSALYIPAWMIGFPTLIGGIVALLILSGVVR